VRREIRRNTHRGWSAAVGEDIDTLGVEQIAAFLEPFFYRHIAADILTLKHATHVYFAGLPEIGGIVATLTGEVTAILAAGAAKPTTSGTASTATASAARCTQVTGVTGGTAATSEHTATALSTILPTGLPTTELAITGLAVALLSVTRLPVAGTSAAGVATWASEDTLIVATWAAVILPAGAGQNPGIVAVLSRTVVLSSTGA
jgi:hypothetical protein